MKNIADLDPAEEKLLAEALFETASDDYYEQDLELEGVENEEQQKSDVPNSKIQFPIRRRRSTRYRNLICFGVSLVLLAVALVGINYLLKSKTVSLDLKLVPGQTLRYKLHQESIYDGVKQDRSSFSEDVFVQVVNQTGNQYWLKIKINSLPSYRDKNFVFLVRVDLDSQNTKDFGDEKRFSVFTSSKRSRELDFYVHNVLYQLLPVVKIDLFEIILSQIITRKHEVTVQDSLLFPGIATMEQIIRSSEDRILITSKISPEGFGAVGSSKTSLELPSIDMTFEEDVSISKSSGMLKSSEMELSAKIPLGEDDESSSGISMKFKSSLSFVKEIASKTRKETMESKNFVKLPRPSSNAKSRLLYFAPSEKEYKDSNVVEKVKEMLRMTSLNPREPLNKEMVEFSKSFHDIVEPGREVSFAAVEQSAPKKTKKLSSDDREKQRWRQTGREHGSRKRLHGNGDGYESSVEENESDRIDENEEPNQRYSDDEGERWKNRSGLAVPRFSEEDSNEPEEENDDDEKGEYDSPRRQDDDDDDEPMESIINEKARNGEPKNKEVDANSSWKPYQRNDNPQGQKNSKLKNNTVRNDREAFEHDGRTKSEQNKRVEHRPFIEKTAAKEEKPKPSDESETKSPHSNRIGKPTHDLDKIKTSEKSNYTTTKPQNHEQNFFSDFFDRLWNEDEENDEDDDNDEYKFPSPIPFSFSSHFPFLHFRWPSFDKRKKRSLETEPHSRKPRDKGHRDKRRLFGRGEEGDTKRPHYTGDDLDMVWDVVSYGKTTARPKKTTPVFQQKIMGMEVKGNLEHEVEVVNTRDKKAEWVIRLSLLLNVGKHRFQVLRKTYTMKEIEEIFIKHSKPKLEYGTVHAGTLIYCTPLFYIENICIEIQLGFVLHVSHRIEHLSKEFPIDLSIFFKHLTRVDAVLSSHTNTLLGSNGVFGHGQLFDAKIPLEVKFSEERSSSKWCSLANLKSKIGHFYERRNELNQWNCPINEAKTSKSNCTGLDEKTQYKATRLWYINEQSKKLHFLNNC